MDETVRAVAQNIRRIRHARDLSLNKLAAQSGVAKGTLAQLESGRGNPTVSTLMTLATSLGVTLADLIAESAMPLSHVTRSDEGTIVRDDGLHLRLVHRTTSPTLLYEIYDMTVHAGMIHRSPAHGPGVVEHLLVHAGKFNVGPVDDPKMLGANDFISFAADRPHLYEAEELVRATLTVHYPLTALGRS